jgi:hypothetical protein
MMPREGALCDPATRPERIVVGFDKFVEVSGPTPRRFTALCYIRLSEELDNIVCTGRFLHPHSS